MIQMPTSVLGITVEHSRRDNKLLDASNLERLQSSKPAQERRSTVFSERRGLCQWLAVYRRTKS